MSLRKRLVLLLGLFAAYAVVAAAVTIYGSQWRVEAAVERFERLAAGTGELERMQVLLAQQQVQLREIVNGRSGALGAYTSARDQFVAGMQSLTSFAPSFTAEDEWSHILSLTDAIEEESNRCLAMLNAGKPDEAAALLTSRIDAELMPSIRTRVTAARTQLDEARNRSARELATTSSQILTLTTIVAVLAIGLVILGTMFIRRWLIRPIAELHTATKRFSEGDLSARAIPRADDELGALAVALNEMAQSVAASEQKYRTLFSNLRDAVVICDREARIIEYHDCDTRLLAVDEGIHAGKPLLDVWPEWREAVHDWSGVIRAAADEGRRFQTVDVRLNDGAHDRGPSFADLLVYRVEYGNVPCVAIVLRDATDRRRLQERVRRAETMEAVGTMAGGLAHDVNNLLTGVSATLSSVATEHSDATISERIQSALRACRRAAGLAKRLLNFASGAQGNPQVFAPGPIVDTILDSMEPAFLEGISLSKDIDDDLHVRMDPDQFAQIVLNLVKNAHDAMSDRGTLRIRLTRARAPHPDYANELREHVLLEVQDSGVGMTPDVRVRVFEPFFTTKPRTSVRGRGMGLAVVYTAVQNAGGFVKVQSTPGEGTTFQVFLPKHGVEAAVPPSDTRASVPM
jgi:signal transduction histidine kinase/HAMP domain-containing protein